MRFKILHGKHAQKEVVSKDPDGKDVVEVRKYQRGDVVETDKDLVALFNQGPFRKFEKLEDPKPVATSKGVPADVPPKRETVSAPSTAAAHSPQGKK